MLVCLGGFAGSGRSDLAGALAERLGWHRCDTRSDFPTLTDAYRLFFFKGLARTFPLLATMHANVILSAPLHRRKPREFLLREAEKQFGQVLFIWVERDGPEATPRLAQRAARMKKEFEPFENNPLVFRHYGPLEDSAARLTEIVEREMRA